MDGLLAVLMIIGIIVTGALVLTGIGITVSSWQFPDEKQQKKED